MQKNVKPNNKELLMKNVIPEVNFSSVIYSRLAKDRCRVSPYECENNGW